MSMGRQTGKEKTNYGDKWRELNLKQIRASGNSLHAHDHDTAMFISMSQELKEEGNRLFQRRDYEGALLKYDKSIKLLPRNHVDIAYVRSNMAECYMQLGIHECYEALKRLDLALRDVRLVLMMEPNNLMATEIEQRLKKMFERQGSRFSEISVDLVPLPDYVEPVVSPKSKGTKDMAKKKRSISLFDGRTGGYYEGTGSYVNEIKGKSAN
ncbi:protein PHOX1 [Sesamum angolense]|uniref:Protein PHOX1 n=1 Tax=Sesamum angolense TaxID=2727404 RepID=A0AAE1T867_9LAMI|nr:protein PHOX1 [Sesamum angolense]